MWAAHDCELILQPTVSKLVRLCCCLKCGVETSTLVLRRGVLVFTMGNLRHVGRYSRQRPFMGYLGTTVSLVEGDLGGGVDRR